MKIQLTLPQQQQVQQFEDCQLCSLESLDSLPNAACTFLYVNNCCDFVPNRQEIFHKIVSKLRYGGEILIEGTDLIEVGYGLSRGLIQTQDVQPLLFGGRYSCSTIDEVQDSLQQLNLQIVNKRLMQYKYSIRAKRQPRQNNV